MESGLDPLAERFRRFAELECGSYEPLYFELATAVAGDSELLQIASQAKAGQPIPNLLFAAVQFRLLQGEGDELRAYYAGLSSQPLPPQEAFGAFKAFVMEHQEAILELLRTRLVQTNEVGRCGPLVPCFTAVQSMGGGRPLALIDVGTSSGLNLNFDRYSIRYDARTT